MNESTCSETPLLNQLRRVLSSDDERQLHQYLTEQYDSRRLVRLLRSDEVGTVRLVAICLGLVGDEDAIGALAQTLHHEDPTAVKLAELAMWSIWFRSDEYDEEPVLKKAVALLHNNRVEGASAILDDLIAHRPDCAEAYNQRAIASFLSGSYQDSISDCCQCLKWNPLHFGATAGMGHCLAQLGQYDGAIDWYHKALGIYPRMEGVRQAIQRVKSMRDLQVSMVSA